MPTPLNPPTPDWVAELDRRLRGLPDRPAPATLIPGVLERIRSVQAAPWWHRAWWAWPKPVQAGSLLLCSGALAVLMFLSTRVYDAALDSYLLAAGQEFLAQVQYVGRTLAAIEAAALSLFCQPGVMACHAIAAFWIVLYLVCVGLGTALYRLARLPHSPLGAS